MDLNLTPVRYKCAMRPWCCAQMLGYAELPREQAARGSLVRAQTRSRLLICACGAEVQSLALLRKTKMDTRNGYPFLFGGEERI